MTIAQGGRVFYGASVGVMVLDTRFPRIPGDIGNAHTWPFPVHFKKVETASPDRVVRQRAEGLLPAFIEAGREMVDQGVAGLTTTCGFLSLFQSELAEALDVPVATSSLMQVPMVQALLPPSKRVGIVTISAISMTPEHLERIGVDPSTPVTGTEGGTEFTRAILNDEDKLDVEASRADVVNAGLALIDRHPEVGAIVCECANMAPYAADLQVATGRPVYSIYSFITWFQAGLSPRRF